ncbi:MAG TPA: DUF2330 domain-containing protein [Candidatus Dormibacteraeota bacterium]|jgi:hypothetical protein|nr:DUF2330 domain-containing protein [Candidatus Dormibacteraeota bacterium]
MLRRALCAAALAGTAMALATVSAAACGGLVARNGAVRLARATTMAAWHDGVEHYVTSFSYQGAASDVGWIVPLPAVPTKVEAAGRWTLQRMVQEFTPPPPVQRFAADSVTAASAGAAQVILQTTVEAVDLTVLKGSAQEVLVWCGQNNFAINDETRAHIEAYAKASPVFMAARYDVTRARELGRFQGDGTPVLITMPTPHLWVPLEVLANASDPVAADIFLITDTRPSSGQEYGLFGLGSSSVGDQLAGAPGLVVQQQETMPQRLHDDLAGDRNMSWVPSTGWVTHLTLNAASPSVTYDMSVAHDGSIRLASLGTPPSTAVTQPPQPSFAPAPRMATTSLLALLALPAALVVYAVHVHTRPRRTP